MSIYYGGGTLELSTGAYRALTSASTTLRPLTQTRCYEVYFTQNANIRYPQTTGTAGTNYIELNMPSGQWNFLGPIDPSKVWVRSTGSAGTFNVRDA